MVTLLHVSIAASPLILCVTVIRLLWWRKIPPRALLVLWSLALCRLLMFFWIPVQNEQARPLLNHIYGGVYNVTYLAVSAAPSRHVLMLIWSAAGIGLLGFVLYRHVRSLLVWRLAISVERPAVHAWIAQHKGWRSVQVVMFGRKNTVFSYGLLHPVIVLSKDIVEGLSDKELKQVLAHELGHIRGLHALLQYLTLAACCLHWFNPLVWVMFFLCQRDMELAADAAVKRYLGKEDAKGYAKLLLRLSMEAAQTGLVKNFIAPSLEERLLALKRPEKWERGLTMLVIALIIMLFVILAVVPSAGLVQNKQFEQHFSYSENLEEYEQKIESRGYNYFNGAIS